MLMLALVFLFLFPVYRLITIIHRRGKAIDIKARNRRNVRTLAVLGSGGHTTEMIRIINSLDECFAPLCLVQADTDRHSGAMAREKIKDKHFSLYKVPRAREVKQPWTTTVLTTVKAVVQSIPIVFDIRPDLLLLNGPGTCIPVVIAAILLQLATSHDVKIVFIESFCRVDKLSMTGQLLYYSVADLTLVQWSQLCRSYPRAKYRGKF